MKANEFRIGNLVNTSERAGRWYQTCRQGVIRTINNDSCNITPIKCISPVITVKFKNIDPIPLTEEWILKFGWEWDIFYQGYFGHNYTMFPNHGGGWRISYCKRKYDMIVEDIQFVHQLQNLYFALTGNELEINKEDEK